jgi:hypothetical protein
MSCTDVPSAFLDARLQGALDTTIHWEAADLTCDGMNRPDRKGLRLSFQGSALGERLTLLFGMPDLPEGTNRGNVPTNLTLIREGRGIYSTQGTQQCALDEVRQAPMPAPEGDRPPRRWQVEARGYCIDPVRALGDTRDAILIARFDFRGMLLWEPDPTPDPIPDSRSDKRPVVPQ